jgi:hypothetical protein
LNLGDYQWDYLTKISAAISDEDKAKYKAAMDEVTPKKKHVISLAQTAMT